MITFFEEKDLVSFGEYLLSDERKQMILDNPEFENRSEDDLKIVYHADLFNWANAESGKRSTPNS